MTANCKLQIANRKSAFTLIELMVVILIIGILVALLIPVASAIRRRGYATTSLAQLNALRGACEAYYQTYNSYPGPIPDLYMYQLAPNDPMLPTGVSPSSPNSRITQSENGVLGL